MRNRNKWKYYFIILVAAAILIVVFPAFINRNNSGVYPQLSFSYVRNDKNIPFNVHLGGYKYISDADGELQEEDLSIIFPADSEKTRNEDVITTDRETEEINFDIDYFEPISDLKVLRWPFYLYGSDVSFDKAEYVNCSKSNRGYEFEADAGYLYSVVVLWNDGYVEYTFQVRKNK